MIIVAGGRRPPERPDPAATGGDPEMLDEWYDAADLSAAQLWIGLAVYVAVLAVFLVAYITIIRRAGYSGWWILVGAVPLLNVVMFFLFAFREWPVQRQLRSARLVASMANVANRDVRFTWE